uniref:DUF4794 domain-containing protein n=1 Tax=Megaselia scalaris TaxID=36166 RepID=T1GBA6_MEGSC
MAKTALIILAVAILVASCSAEAPRFRKSKVINRKFVQFQRQELPLEDVPEQETEAPAVAPYPPAGITPETPFELPTETTVAPAPAQEYGPPAQEYGPPAVEEVAAPAQEYGPPAQEYGPPAVEEVAAPAQEYGPPIIVMMVLLKTKLSKVKSSLVETQLPKDLLYTEFQEPVQPD